MIKKTLIFLSGAIFFGGIALAAPTSTFHRNLLPELNQSYDIGTTTPALEWRTIYTKDLFVSGTCTGCGGGGGGGSGTVSTSTNETAGFLSYWTSNSGTPALLGKVATTTLTGTAPITFSQPISVIGSSASVITCAVASGSLAGCLSTADWTTFNSKESPLTFTYPLTRSVNAISTVATSSLNLTVGTFLSPNISQWTNDSGYTTNTGTVTSIATTYPITGGTITSSGTLSLAFGTTTANTWADTQTFSKAINVTEGTTATSTFSGNARIVGNLQVDGKFFAPVTLVSSGNTTVNGDLTVTGATTLATSLTGFLKGTSGLVSAVSSIVPADISLTKGNFLVGNDAGVAQATSTIFVSSTGNVGIGTTNPLAKLQVGDGSSLTNYQGAAVGILLPAGSGSWLELADNSTFGTAFRISQDSSTGIAFNSNGRDIGFKADSYSTAISASQLVLKASGNVGIGTTAPGANLDVKASSGDSTFRLTRGGGQDYGIQLTAVNNDGNVFIDSIGNHANPVMQFRMRTLGTPVTAMTILGSGNVGIGTTTPILKLSIANTSSDGISITNTSQSANNKIFAIQNNGSNLRLAPLNDSGSATADGLQIDRSGNVGIGTTTPGFRFSVGDVASQFYIDSAGKVVAYDTANSWEGRLSPTRSFVLGSGTTTTWTASTTNSAYSPFIQMPFAGTLRQVRCGTDASFLGVNVVVAGSNATPSYFVASTTIGKVPFTAGNTFTAGQKILANFGTTTTATAQSISCTFDVTETP